MRDDVERPVRARAASSRACAGGRSTAPTAPVRSRACWPISTLSSTDRLANSRMFWKVRAMPCVAGSGAAAGRASRRRRSGCCRRRPATRPVMTLNSVDLPEPFGPITATTPPAGTVMSTAFSATRPPKRTVTPLTSSAGSPSCAQRRRGRVSAVKPPRRTSACCCSKVSAGLLARGRDQALAPEQHHEHQDHAEDQLDRLRQVDVLQPVAVDRLAERVDPAASDPAGTRTAAAAAGPRRAPRPRRCPCRRARPSPGSYRDREAEHLRRRGLQLGDVEHAGHAGERRADGEGQQLECGCGRRPSRRPRSRPRGSPSRRGRCGCRAAGC